jgi:hypothetical protein
MKVQPTIEISGQQIADQFVAAFEGGANYWMQRARLLSKHELPERPWYCNGALFDADDFQIEVYFDRPEDPEGAGKGRKIIGPKDVRAGLELLSRNRAQRLAEILDESGDADTADEFMQMIVLGSLVYG